MKEVLLYHGSRGGIIGNIQPISRERCDFGKGFYMGTNYDQARSLVSNDQQPVIYTISASFSNIPNDNILKLNGMPWAYTVLLNRGRLDNYRNTKLYHLLTEHLQGKEVLIGPIADDNMNRVMKQFISGEITDKVFLECIKAIDYGVQYVAKSQRACDSIQIIAERELDDKEISEMQHVSEIRREKGLAIVDTMKRQYRREGQYLDEILDGLEKEHEEEINYER